MKKFVLAVLIASGCGGSSSNVADTTTPAATAPTDAAPSQADLQKKTLAAYEAAWVARDPQLAATFYTEDGVVKMTGAPDVSGREAIATLIGGMFSGSKDAKFPFSRTFQSGNVVIGEWVWAGTHSGTMMGLPATNKPFGVMGVTVYQFSPEGLIQEARLYVDMGTLMSQLGISPQPARAIRALPTDAPTESVAADGALEQRNLAAAKRMIDALGSKREAEFLSALTDDIAWDDMMQPATMNGKDAAKQFFQQMTTAFPDATFSAESMWAAGDYVICENRMTGTHKGPLGPIPATGKAVDLHAIDIMQFDADGKLVRGWTYGNSFELLMQLGLLNAGPPAK